MNSLSTDTAEQLGKLLLQNHSKVTTAESCTGGGVASAITDIAGSSKWFEFGYVTYANRAKEQLLGVPSELLIEYGAVSEPVVEAMAAGARANAGADLSVAISGIAGPSGGTAEKPVGTVWFCWQYREKSITRKCLLEGDREGVRIAAVEISLQGLIDILQK